MKINIRIGKYEDIKSRLYDKMMREQHAEIAEKDVPRLALEIGLKGLEPIISLKEGLLTIG